MVENNNKHYYEHNNNYNSVEEWSVKATFICNFLVQLFLMQTFEKYSLFCINIPDILNIHMSIH